MAKSIIFIHISSGRYFNIQCKEASRPKASATEGHVESIQLRGDEGLQAWSSASAVTKLVDAADEDEGWRVEL